MTKNYINRDLLLDNDIFLVGGCTTDPYISGYFEALDAVEDAINAIPVEDVVKAIRCNQCVYWITEFVDDFDNFTTQYCRLMQRARLADDYCSDAIKKEND